MDSEYFKCEKCGKTVHKLDEYTDEENKASLCPKCADIDEDFDGYIDLKEVNI